MTNLRRICSRFWLTLLVFFFASAARGESPVASEQLEFFEKQVRPLLVEHCQQCHGAQQQKGGLRLDSRAAVAKGGDSGPAVVIGKPEESELIKAISYDADGYQMPPKGKLAESAIATLTEWVRIGAPWPDEAVAQATGVSFEEEFARRAKHWSFQSINRPSIPKIREHDWPLTPVDFFVQAKREEAGLPHAAATDRRTWLRRVTFDTIGLPPTQAEYDAFLSDPQPDAYERVVNRLLASPHYGERWGRHWLDLARYAESRGHEFDFDVANPWHYRDFVIGAFNDDVPFDQFVVEQVAGDLLPRSNAPGNSNRSYVARLDPMSGANNSLVGTGFWLLGEWVHSPVDIRKEEAERFDNMLDVFGKTFLGLTIACARCHDHKFDPITQEDYFALSGFLKSSVYTQRPFDTLDHNREIQQELRAVRDEHSKELVATLVRQAKPVVTDLDKYLRAAGSIIKDAGKGASEESESTRIAAAAARLQLDGPVLAEWVRHLRAAANDKLDPFFLWSQFSAHGNVAPLEEEAKRLVPKVSEVASASPISETDRRPHIWGTDGYAFILPDGSSGESDAPRLLLSGNPESPIASVSPALVTEIDPDVAGVLSAGQIMGEPGSIGRIRRGGRTLTTSTFLIQADRLYCRVRGACNTYLAVDSHITLAGPLHGGLYREHKAEEGWRWIEHDLSRYHGHHAHLEFVVPPNADFAVSELYQRDQPPWTGSLERQSVAAEIAAGVASADHGSIETAELWSAPFQKMSPSASVLDWIARHPALFALNTESSRKAFTQVSQIAINRRNGLIAELKAGSAFAPCLLDGSAVNESLHIRGNPSKPGSVVPRRFLTIFGGGAPGGEIDGSGRLNLARRMVDSQQTPILPRVIVNRLWKHAFGRGLAPTVDDFGFMGQAPSHPELLDWLASELVRKDWSLKAIQREILLSATYRMQSDALSGDVSEVVLQKDPENVLLHRMNVKRLEAEVIRDEILAHSGRLDDQLYGPSVPIHLTEFLEGRGRPGASGPVDGQGRRSVYLSIRRNFLEPFLVAFDFPTPHTSIGRRSVSNVPAQALALMNNPLVQEQTKQWAERLIRECEDPAAEVRIERLYRDGLGRSPSDQERIAALTFVDEMKAGGSAELDIWTGLCHVVVNVKEFIFIR